MNLMVYDEGSVNRKKVMRARLFFDKMRARLLF